MVCCFAFFACFSLLAQLKESKSKVPQINSSASMLCEAEKHMLLEDYAKATEYYHQSLSYDRRNEAAHYRLAQLCIYGQDNQCAMQHVEEALAIDPANKYFHILMAEIQEISAKPFDAIRARRRVLEIAPSEHTQRYEIARLYIRAGNEKKALRVYDEIEERTGYTEELGRKRQALLFQIKAYSAARREAERLSTAFPQDIHFRLLYVDVLLATGDLQAAAVYLADLWQAYNKPVIGLALADVYLQNEQWEAAEPLLGTLFGDKTIGLAEKTRLLLPYFERLVAEQPRLVARSLSVLLAVYSEEEQPYILMGDFHLRSGRMEESLSYYLQAIQRGSADLTLWRNVITFQINLSQHEEALIHLDRAISLYPEQFSLYVMRGDLLSMQGQHKAALRSFERGFYLCDDDVLGSQIQARMGDSFHALSNDEAADEAYERALTLDENNAHALNNYSYFLALRKQKLVRAKVLARQLISLHKNNPNYLDTYAWVMYADGQYSTALRSLKKAIRLGADDAVIYEHYGDVYYRLGRVEEAVKQWKKAVNMAGASSSIQEKIIQKKLPDGH